MISNEDMKLFFNEAEELLQKIENSILELEENPKNNKPIQELFFAFHTIKGLVGMIGLENLSKFCHEFENLLEKNKEYSARSKQGDSFINLLFESLDIIRNIIAKLKLGEKKDLDEKNLIEITDAFQEFDVPAGDISTNTISETELEEIKKQSTFKFYKIYFRIQETCVFKKVRLYIIFRALNTIGKICASNPNLDALVKGRFDWDFEIYFVSKESSTSISNALEEILEIEKKIIKDSNYNEIKDFISNISKKKTEISETKNNFKEIVIENNDSNISESTSEKDYSSSIVEDYENIPQQITSVKVNLDTLEKLMNNFGEVVILKNQLSQYLQKQQQWEISRLFDNMDKHFLEIQEIIFNLKLVKVENTFDRYKRLVRDLSKETGKSIKFILEGLDVEVDRKILEELNSPIIHLLRNAIYHGIEHAKERSLKNKDITGVISLKTIRRASSIYIEVSDDGKGIDYDRVRQKLVEKGRYTSEEVTELTREELNREIFTPGFSTISSADMVSGRGMGLAIVKEKVKELGGSIEIYSEIDAGSTFRIIVPFTRAILKAQLIKVGGDLFAIPIEHINQIYFFKRELIEYVKNAEYYRIQSKLIPIIRLDKYLNYLIKNKEDQTQNDSHVDIALWCRKDENNSVMLIVNDVLQQMELVIKPFRSKFSDFNEILGVSITGDGSICLVIDVLNIISSLEREVSNNLQLIETKQPI